MICEVLWQNDYRGETSRAYLCKSDLKDGFLCIDLNDVPCSELQAVQVEGQNLGLCILMIDEVVLRGLLSPPIVQDSSILI